MHLRTLTICSVVAVSALPFASVEFYALKAVTVKSVGGTKQLTGEARAGTEHFLAVPAAGPLALGPSSRPVSSRREIFSP